MSIEAMKLALDCLEDIFGKDKIDVGAINALRQAIADAEKQEPHCYMDEYGYVEGEMKQYMEENGGWYPVYTTPPQRKPLTDEQLIAAYESEQQGRYGDHIRSLRAIEAAHGIKGE